jgi:PKD repeat protein
VISGTPTSAGISAVAISSTNAGGTGSANLTITVKPRLPVITSGASAAGKVGSTFNYKILANDASSYAVVGTLPSGLAYNSSTKSITGTPTKPGTYNITLRATNTIGYSTKVLTISIQSAAPVITSKTDVSGKVKKSFSYKVTATNSPTSYSAKSLPNGLKIDAKTGIITGKPSKNGVFNVEVRAVNKYEAGSKKIKITISK